MAEIKREDYELPGQFYLGRGYDLEERQPGQDIYLYDSRDLLTHAVCIGMTGSGKTGLCISLLEEALFDGIPVIAIDPKGDLGNLLLTFPNLEEQEFLPWVREDEARRENLSVEQYARQQAVRWREGLGEWGQSAERIRQLREKAEFSIYTPGSTAGKPVSILSSFCASSKDVVEDREQMGDRISNTVTSLLTLLGFDDDPLTSREHILLAKIVEHAWADGKDLSLTDLVHHIQNPPMTKVGAFDLESFFPGKERFALAMKLNNLLASPGFDVWLEGDPLDIDSLLFNKAGKPRLSIFSINHLSDSERMFFVSLLLNQLLSWMRGQSGSSSLRALFYMDEIYGYFPPVAKPPSKPPLITLLKQARAFGLGLVLATQNPADLDYKGLSNIGTWFIGRLQTERDKARVLEGLKGTSTSDQLNDRELDEVLNGLGNRVFLVNNVHEVQPHVIQTRWAMSYLRGPFSREDIKRLRSSNADSSRTSSDQAAQSSGEERKVAVNAVRETQRPAVDPQIREYFLPRNASNQIQYQPMLLVSAWARFSKSNPPVDHGETYDLLIPFSDGPFSVLWDEGRRLDCPVDSLSSKPSEGMSFDSLIPKAADPKSYKKWSTELTTWIYQKKTLELFKSASLKETSKVGESERDFRIRLQLVARQKRDEMLDKLRTRYNSRMERLNNSIQNAERAAERERRQANDATVSSAIQIGASLLGAFTGRKTTISGNLRRAGSAARSANRAAHQQGDTAIAEEKILELQQQLTEVEDQLRMEMSELELNMQSQLSEQLEKVAVSPKKADIGINLLTLAWVPVASS